VKLFNFLLITAILPWFAIAKEAPSDHSFSITTPKQISILQHDLLSRNYKDLDGNNFKPLSKSKPYSYVVIFEAFQSWEGDGPEEQIKQIKLLGNKKVQVSMIHPNMNTNESMVESFRKDFGLQNTHVLIDKYNKLTSALGVWQTPTHFLFDNKGRLLGKATGQSNDLVKLLKQLLKDQ